METQSNLKSHSLNADDIESLSLEEAVRIVLSLPSSRMRLYATTHRALVCRLSRARLSGRLKQVVASSLLCAAPSSEDLRETRKLIGSWLPAGALVLEMVTNKNSSPSALESLPAADVINAACLGFYKLNASGVLAIDIDDFFSDIAYAYGSDVLRLLAAPAYQRLWWTPSLTPGNLTELCSSLKALPDTCQGQCRLAAVSYVLQAGNGPLNEKILYFHSVLGEDRSQLFSALVADLGPVGALSAAEAF